MLNVYKYEFCFNFLPLLPQTEKTCWLTDEKVWLSVAERFVDKGKLVRFFCFSLIDGKTNPDQCNKIFLFAREKIYKKKFWKTLWGWGETPFSRQAKKTLNGETKNTNARVRAIFNKKMTTPPCVLMSHEKCIYIRNGCLNCTC